MLVRWGLVILFTLALVGAVYAAAASLTVSGVDELGSGSADVLAPDGPVEVTSVAWSLATGSQCGGDSSKVHSVLVTFLPIPDNTYDSLSLVLKDGAGAVLKQRTFLNQSLDGVGVGLNTITWLLTTGNSGSVVDPNCVPAADIALFAITVVDEAP